jgi:5-methylthioadenosine/S-adenosylhomocysteine deaminase
MPARMGRKSVGEGMQSVDLVIAGIDWLITVDPSRRIIRDAAVAVDAGKIVAIGKSDEIAKAYTGVRQVDGRHTVATPGFVDCHLHASFQLSRGLADEANAQSFLFDRMYPYEAALEGDDVRVSATLAGTELLKHGVTCSIDPGNYHPARRSKA